MFYSVDDNHITNVYDEEELAQIIVDTIKWYKEMTQSLAKSNQELRNNAEDKVRHEFEAEIEYLKKKLSLSYGQFASQKEKDAYDDFERRHMHERQYLKIQGGKAPYLIPTGTGIGTILEVVCPICGEKENITDMEVW